MYRLTVCPQGTATSHTFDLDREVVLVGRRPGCDVPLPDERIGGVHLRLLRDGQRVTVVDAGTVIGTRVNGEALAPGGRRDLAEGDEIVVADCFSLRFQASSDAAHATSAGETAQLARAMVRALLGDARAQGAPDDAWLEITEGPATGRRLSLPAVGASFLLGRGESCELIVRDADLSREHVRLERTLGGVTITDLGSKNGTSLEGTRLPTGQAVPLPADRVVALGATRLRLHDPAEAVLARLAALPEPGAALAAEVAPPATVPPPDHTAPGPARRSRLPLVIAAAVVVGAIALLVLLLTS